MPRGAPLSESGPQEDLIGGDHLAGRAFAAVCPPSALQTPQPGFSMSPVTNSLSQPISTYHVPSPLVTAAVACFSGRKMTFRRKRAIHVEELASKGHKLIGVQDGPPSPNTKLLWKENVQREQPLKDSNCGL